MNEIEQKQIEEMANILDDYAFQYVSRGDFDLQEWRAFATEIYNAGYRNVKDKVVLSKEEWAILQGKAWASTFKEAEISQLKEELNDYKQRYESSEKRYEQLVQSSCEALEKGKEQACKETAREILTKLFPDSNIFNDNDVILIWQVKDLLKELVKAYGVEVDV